MKIALLFLCLFLLAFSTSAQVVVDTDGDSMLNGGSYYILPVLRGRGGGVGLARTGNETCPLTVAQSRSEVDRGSLVRISSPYLILYLTEGLPLELAFTAVPTCANTPSKWTVVEGLAVEGSVKITGYGNTLPGWFQIQRYESYGSTSDYKLRFCPSGTETCKDIGIYIDDEGIRQLVVTDEDKPFVVQFAKDTESKSAFAII